MIRRASIFALIAGIFGLLQIRQALDQGRFAFPISYDDTTYFRQGLGLLHALFDRGVPAFFAEWWNSPPHSPWSALTAFTGFAVFGPHDWAAAAINVAVLAAMAAGLAVVVRGLPMLPSLAMLVAVLTWPYFGHLIVDARPDMVWGASLAGFTAVVATGATEALRRRDVQLAAVLLAVVLMTKVTTLPVSLAIVGVACIATLVAHRRWNGDAWRDNAVALAIAIAAAAAVALPHYAIGLGHIYRYVVANVVGAQSQVWELDLDAQGHLMYHLTGAGGQAMMGSWLALWLLTLTAFATNVVYTGDRRLMLRSAAFGAAFVVAFMAVTAPAHKSPHIGAVVPAFFLVSWVLMNVHLLGAAQSPATRRTAAALLAVATIVGLATFQWQASLRHGPPFADRFTEAGKRHADVADVLAAVDRAGFASARIFVAGATPYLNAETLRYYALKQRRDGIVFTDALFGDAGNELRTRIAESDGVLLPTPDHGEVLTWLPSGRGEHLQRAADYVARDSRFDLALALPPHAGPGEFRLYLRKPPLQLPRDAEGFGPVEGPYPQFELPIVRWGLGPTSRFTVPGDQFTRLLLSAQTPHAGQVLVVSVDGVEHARHAFATTNRPEDIIVALPAAHGSRRNVELRYSAWSPGTAADPRPMAVLFRRVQWQ